MDGTNHMVPLNIQVGETSYLDKVTHDTGTFHTLVEGMEEYPSSAQPSPKVVEGLFSTLLRHYDQILVITVASVQSGTISYLPRQPKKWRGGKQIEVIDSKQNSGAEDFW